MCLYVYECALLERWVYFFCVTFPAFAFSDLFVILCIDVILYVIVDNVHYVTLFCILTTNYNV